MVAARPQVIKGDSSRLSPCANQNGRRRATAPPTGPSSTARTLSPSPLGSSMSSSPTLWNERPRSQIDSKTARLRPRRRVSMLTDRKIRIPGRRRPAPQGQVHRVLLPRVHSKTASRFYTPICENRRICCSMSKPNGRVDPRSPQRSERGACPQDGSAAKDAPLGDPRLRPSTEGQTSTSSNAVVMPCAFSIPGQDPHRPLAPAASRPLWRRRRTLQGPSQRLNAPKPFPRARRNVLSPISQNHSIRK